MATAAEIASQSQFSLGSSLYETMQVTILNNILTGLGVTMTQQEINTAAACFLCYGMSLAQAQALVLLNAIAGELAGGGGGGGSQEVYQGAFADPNGNVTPDDPTKSALYFPDGGGTLWQFDVPSQTWV